MRSRILASDDRVLTKGFITDGPLRMAMVTVPPRFGFSEAASSGSARPNDKLKNRPINNDLLITIPLLKVRIELFIQPNMV
jgi:hypothetical protein